MAEIINVLPDAPDSKTEPVIRKKRMSVGNLAALILVVLVAFLAGYRLPYNKTTKEITDSDKEKIVNEYLKDPSNSGKIIDYVSQNSNPPIQQPSAPSSSFLKEKFTETEELLKNPSEQTLTNYAAAASYAKALNISDKLALYTDKLESIRNSSNTTSSDKSLIDTILAELKKS